MIKCGSCGKELPDDSLYCNKCGSKIEHENELTTENEITKDNQFVESNISSGETSNQIKIRRIIILGIVAALICISSYIGFTLIDRNYKKNVTSASHLYMMGDYAGAHEKIKQLIARKSDKDLFDKISLLYLSSMELSFSEYFLNEGEFDSALEFLLIGLTKTYESLERAKELGVEFRLNSIKTSYLEKLFIYFNLSEEEVQTIINLDGDLYAAKIKELAQIGKINASEIQAEKERQERLESNPFEIVDTKGEKRGDFLYLTGVVKNNGETTHSNIKVEATFYDVDGNVVETDWNYAAQELKPGEQKSFSITAKYHEEVRKYKIEIIDFD